MGSSHSFYFKNLDIGEEQPHDECQKYQSVYQSDDEYMVLIELPSKRKYVDSFKALLCNRSESNACFCLFRHNNKEKSIKYFKLLQYFLPAFYENHNRTYSKEWLKRILRMALKYKKESALQIARRIRFVSLIDDPSFISKSKELHDKYMEQTRDGEKKKKISAFASKELINSFSFDIFGSQGAALSNTNFQTVQLHEQTDGIANHDTEVIKANTEKSVHAQSDVLHRDFLALVLLEDIRKARINSPAARLFIPLHWCLLTALAQGNRDEARQTAHKRLILCQNNLDLLSAQPTHEDDSSYYSSSEDGEGGEQELTQELGKSSTPKGSRTSLITKIRTIRGRDPQDIHEIFKAVKKNRLSRVKDLIEENKDNMYLKSRSRKGNVPLHYSTSDKMILLFVSSGCNPSIKNKAGETLLHMLTIKSDLQLLIFLLTCGADVNAKGINDKTPLHYAVQMNDLVIVKRLLVFGADPEIRNKNGVTPLAMAERGGEDSREVYEALTVYSRFPNAERNYAPPVMRTESGAPMVDESVPKFKGPSILKQKTGKESVLCLDGGGIRGLMTTEMLIVLCKICGKQPVELFDWIAGTSTGAYQGLLLSKGIILREIVCGYFRLKNSVFSGGRPYNAKVYEALLQDSFGVENTMDEIEHPRVIVNAVAADFKPAQLHVFRNYEAPYAKLKSYDTAKYEAFKEPCDQLIWKSARYSMSAPSYFRPLGDSYIDGGLIANNPTLDALDEIQKYHNHFTLRNSLKKHPPSLGCVKAEIVDKRSLDNVGLMLSLGTGQPPEEIVPTVDLFPPTSLNEAQKLVSGLRSFMDLLLDQTTATDMQVVDRAKSWCESLGLPYYRFNPVMMSPCEMDEEDDNLVIEMMYETRKFLKQNYELFREVANILICKSEDKIEEPHSDVAGKEDH